MNRRTLAELAELIEAGGQQVELVGDQQDAVGPDVVIDSRQVTGQALFVALPGEHVDGHDYLHQAAAAGAAAAITSRPVDASLPQLVCAGGAQAGLTALARSLHRQARGAGLQTVAITGSAGKTSTKDLLAQLLAAHGATTAPVGSYNNELGTPLTVCQVDDQTRYLVSEMGSRSKGDIAHLCSIVQPDASIVLNVGSAHLGEFGSQQAIAAAKGEIIQALQPDGWAVLNADDPLVDAMAADTARIARFTVGLRPVSADLVVRADDLVPDDLDRFAFNLTASRGTDQQQARIQLRLLGRHQVTNAAAAATAALAVGVPFDLVAQVLNRATVRSPWRMELHELPSGAAVINDAYNANPDSMAAALRTLAAIGDRRRASHPQARITAVLGDMLELGPQSAELHSQIGELAANLDIDEVIAVGQYAAELAAGAVRAGGQGRTANAESVAESLELASGDVVLVKASRGLRLERVADALVGGEVDK